MKTDLFNLTLFLILSLSVNLQAQNIKLNRFGRIEEKSAYKSSPVKYFIEDGEYCVKYNNFKFTGNNIYTLHNNLLTITEYEEFVPAVLRIYSFAGELQHIETFKRIINVKFSPKRQFIIFFDGRQTIVLNTETFEKMTYPPSIVYAVDDDGYPIYCDELSRKIFYRNVPVSLEEQPYDILINDNVPIIFTRKNILSLERNETVNLIHLTGSFFEAKIINDRMYVVERSEQNNRLSFKLYELSKDKSLNRIDYMEYTPNSIESHENIFAPLKYSVANYAFPIGNSYGEIQQYGGAPYLHPGVDFLGEDNENVYAVKSGIVKAILTTSGDYHWRIAIANRRTADTTEGYLYAHLNYSSFRFAVGDSVTAGDILGTLVPWMGWNFTHCHFARIKAAGSVWNGAWWTTDNPLVDVSNMKDSDPPVFENARGNDLFAFRRSYGLYLDPSNLHGEIQIISNCYDYANSYWRIDVRELSYKLFTVSNPGTPIYSKFSFSYDFPIDGYFSNEYQSIVLNTIYSMDDTCYSIGNYDYRKYYQIISNSNGDTAITSEDQLQRFDTRNFPDGDYLLEVIAKDASMNSDSASMLINIMNSPPVMPNLISPGDNSIQHQLTVTLRWHKSTGTESYRLQVARDNAFTSIVFDDSTLTDTTKQVGSLSNCVNYYWRVRSKNSIGRSPWSMVWYFTAAEYSTIQIPVTNRWNLISVPVEVEDNFKSFLFPTSTSDAFAYISGSGYLQKDTLARGTGYWLKFPNATGQKVNMPGFLICSETLRVQKGWNLIGSISEPIVVSSIISDPPCIATSIFFGYNNGYTKTDTIFPGKGCWVKVSQSGSLILRSSTMSLASNRIKIIATSEFPPPPPGEAVFAPPKIPTEFALEQNYPNPFNPNTTIKYQLPFDSRVTLKVYDVLGQIVATLAEEIQSAGYKSVEWNASNISSGIYFYRLEAASISNPSKSFTQVKKMLLLK